MCSAGMQSERFNMTMDYELLISQPPIETTAAFTIRDTILYALGLGVGSDNPAAPKALQFVYEEGLKALPTMAVVLATPGFWFRDPRYGIAWQELLHGEQSLELHKPLPVEGEVRSELTVDEIYDKGAERGALLCATRRLYENRSGDPLATLGQSYLLRGNGGFGGPREGAAKPHPMPDSDRTPDVVREIATRVDQALIYRLSGDYNPLHIDPVVAARAGFDRPILHGLCTYGIAGRAVVEALCDNEPAALERLDVRFTSPVLAGDTLRIECWCESSSQWSLRARALERDRIVLDNGRVVIDPMQECV